MENKKISLSFGIVVIAFLVVFYILLKDFNNKRVNDYKEYIASITNIVKAKNNKIRILSNQLAEEIKVIQDLKNTLADTRNELETLSNKLAQQAPVLVHANVPPAEPAAASK